MRSIVRDGRIALLVVTIYCGLAPLDALAQQAIERGRTTVRIAEIAREFHFLPAYLALSKGWFREEGLEVEIVTAGGPDEATARLLAGTVDIVAQGAENAVYSAGSAAPIKAKIIAGLTATDGMFLVSRTRIAAEEFRWDMLKGKSVLARRVGSAPGMAFDYVLRNRGFAPRRDMDLRQTLPIPAFERAWRRGEFDFATFYEPTASQLEREGVAHVVASVGMEIGPLDQGVLMATDSFIRDSPVTVQRCVNAIQRSLAWISDASPEDVARAASDFLPNAAHADLVSAARRFRQAGIWKQDATISRKAISDLQSIMIETEVMRPEKRATYEALVEPRFAEMAKRK